jgi:hypothetical protein
MVVYRQNSDYMTRLVADKSLSGEKYFKNFQVGFGSHVKIYFCCPKFWQCMVSGKRKFSACRKEY